jgi:hypothetical protein
MITYSKGSCLGIKNKLGNNKVTDPDICVYAS